MTFPKPALEQLTCAASAPWVRTYNLNDENSTGLALPNGEAFFEFWDEPREEFYGAGVVVWLARDPASVRVTVAVPVLQAILAAAPGGIGYGDLLIVHNERRQYLVEVQLTVTP